MKDYVDELPVDCYNCPCCNNEDDMNYICNMIADKPKVPYKERLPDCPLIPIEPWRLESCKTCGLDKCVYFASARKDWSCGFWEPK